jgi:hypothetical protein
VVELEKVEENMTEITFESYIQDNTVETPKEYRFDYQELGVVTSAPAKVFQRITLPAIRHAGRGNAPMKFSEPHFDTLGFKFDRDEANER